MKMTEKTKRRLAIGGGIAICAGLLAAISLRFVKPPVGEDNLPEWESSVAEVTITPPPATESGEDGSEELTIQPVQTEAPAQTEPPAQSEQSVQTEPPAQSEQPEQSIQPEVEKPDQPDEETLANPEEKPDGTKVEVAPEPVDHDTYVPPAGDGGGNSGGGLPGFENVPNLGENTATQADNMYENGNKIGSMD